ncbi:hypothetical protein J2S74_005429 [Evansella vedderi]|uniref:Uncharacterized protein n=1 Tax=Evansella vedderi TaxID=38282 RepID=A0ABU0A4S5_9BACI|nr:hypothetical protein [Evansella vedderi]MDQ0257966.1 hypothetical protein [Evansella vedderi]
MYNVRPQILPVVCIFSIVIFWNVLREFYGVSSSSFLLFLLLVIVSSSYRFKFIINDDHLVYQVFILFKYSVFKKEIYPEQIKELKFFEVGWFKKAAVIKCIKGMNIRLAILEPTEAYDHLLGFARKHNITIYKTKDYLRLERRVK